MILNLEGSPFSSYKIIRQLGSGSYGTVYHVKSQDSQDYVIKSINLESLSDQNQLLKEVEILESYKHPHLISYLASCIHNNKLLILLEFAPGGDLQNLINVHKSTRRFISEKKIWTILHDICKGVEYLHKNKIIHRDIKCLNILLNHENRVKIADLGVSKILSHKNPMAESQVGTPLYFSPEMIQKKPYDYKIDIWAIGCIAYNLTKLEPPFQADNLLALAKMIVKARPKPIQDFYSPRLSGFIFALLDKRVDTRPGFTEIFKMIPGSVKDIYRPPGVYIKAKEDFKDKNNCFEAASAVVRPIYSNSKDKIGSIKKHPNQFQRLAIEKDKYLDSRNLNIKPMPNFQIVNNVKVEVSNAVKNFSYTRPRSGVISKDLDMVRGQRPASALNYRRSTARELESLSYIC